MTPAQMVNIDATNWKFWIALFIVSTLASLCRSYLRYKERKEMRSQGIIVPVPPEDSETTKEKS